MKKRLAREAAPPSDLERSTRISYLLILAALGTCLLVGLIGLNFHDRKLVLTMCGTSLALVVPFWLFRRGHYRAGNLVLMVIVLATVTVVATIGQGIRDVAVMTYPVVFIYVGLTSDRVVFRVCAGLTFVATLWLALGEALGWFATVPLFPDPLNLFYLSTVTVLLTVTGMAVGLLSANLRRSLQKAHQGNEERKRADESLRESHLLLTEMGRMAHVGAWVLDRTATEMKWTEEMYRIHEVEQSYRPTIAAGLEFLDPASRPLMAQAMGRARETGEPFDLELQLVTAKGNHRWVRAIGKEDKEGGKGYGTLQDITERKQAEQALLESNDLFSQFLLHSPIYAYIKEVTPTESRVVQASENYRDMIGVPGHAMAGKTMEELFPAELAARMTADDWAVVSGGKVLELDEQLEGRQYTSIKFPIHRQDTTYLAGYTIDVTERRRTEAMLRAGEDRFRMLFESAPIAINISRGPDIVYANPSYLTMHGLSTMDELRRCSPLGLFAPEWRPRILENIERRARGLEVLNCYEAECLRKDGAAFPVLMYIARAAFVDGPATVAFTIDITERKRAEEALRASEERFRRLFEGSASVNLIVDGETGAIVDANAAAAAFYGWQIDELRRMRIQQINTLPAKAVKAELDRVLSSAAERFEFCHRRADGSVRDVEVFSSRIQIGEKAVLYSIIHDITERKRAEKALRESEERFQTLIDRAPVAISVSRNGTGLYANRAFLAMFGMERAEDAIGRPIAEYFAPPAREESRERTRRRALGLLVPAAFESIGIRAGGSPFPGHVEVAEVQLPDGAASVAFVTDLTDRKRAEEDRERLAAQLVQAQKMESVGRLAGGVAHDFNNMLGVILGHAELALNQVDSSHPLRDNLDEIRKATVRSADLTRQLLAFARRQTVAPRVLDLNEVVERMLKMLRRLIGEAIRLEWRPHAALWPIRVDPSQVDQILANLCVNARDAIGGVGTITIETGNSRVDEAHAAEHAETAPGEYAVLSVRDDGCGMDEETLSHLFEPFFTTKGVGEGTGLGLATVYGAVKQNGGFVEVESEPGKGSAFAIYLPRHGGSHDEDRREAAADPLTGGHETILMVEDEPAVLSMTKMVLEQRGYTVLAASTPTAGLRLAREHPTEIRLLMTDVVMPEMNGRELARTMHSLYPRLKCLFMSGHTADVLARDGLLSGEVHFIQKPFSIRELAAKVRATLDSG